MKEVKVRVLDKDYFKTQVESELDSCSIVCGYLSYAIIKYNDATIVLDTECVHFVDKIKRGVINHDPVLCEIPFQFRNYKNELYQSLYEIKEKDIDLFFKPEEVILEDFIQDRYKTHNRIKANYNGLLRTIKQNYIWKK